MNYIFIKSNQSYSLVKLTILALTITLFSACSVYKPEVRQGNIATPTQVALLKVGMNRQQVQQTLGTPLLQDVFNTNRWDYVYRTLKSDGKLEQRVMTVFFDKEGKVTHWIGDTAPSQNEMSNKPSPVAAKVVNVSPNVAPSTLVPSALAAQAVPSTVLLSTPNNSVDNKPNPPIVKVETAPLPATTTASVPAVAVSPVSLISAQPLTQTTDRPLVASEFQILIEKKVADWRAAWASKNITAYTAHYASDYAGDYLNHKTWLAKRKKIISNSNDISIVTNDIKVIQTSHDEARATFTQIYSSNQISQTGSKNLFLKRFGDTWFIVAEIFSKTN